VALKNNLESLGEMSAGLAHEFKNAIATLQGYAQLLQSMELTDNAHAATSSLLNEVKPLGHGDGVPQLRAPSAVTVGGCMRIRVD